MEYIWTSANSCEVKVYFLGANLKKKHKRLLKEIKCLRTLMKKRIIGDLHWK
jgi:hypothetical protein